MEMEQTECSKKSAYKIQTPENYPEEIIQLFYGHFVLFGHLVDIEASEFKMICCLLLCPQITSDRLALSELKCRKFRIIGRKYVFFSTLKLRELYHKFNSTNTFTVDRVAQSV